MKRLLSQSCYCTSLIIFGLLLGPAAALGQADSPIRIDLVATKTEYLDTEPIKIRVTVTNDTDPARDIDAQEGFFSRDFDLLIEFIDPDGRVVRTFVQPGGAEPGPPESVADAFGAIRDAVPCETIGAGEFTHNVVEDIKLFYDLRKVGPWQGRVVSSLETFAEAVNTRRGRRCFLKSAADEDLTENFPVLVSNLIRFNIVRAVPVAESGIQARAQLMKIGTGTHPPVEKSDILGMPVKLIPDSLIPDDFRPINHKTYGLIFQNVRGPGVKSAKTGAGGRVHFLPEPQAAYVLVARHGPSGITVGAKIDADEPEWSTGEPIFKSLKIIQNDKGKKTAGKATRRRGSDLWIVEPEYVEWNGAQEPYPFVFETVGDWSITTSVSPPEGFVSDYPELSADVNSETEAIQFKIIDVGSSWKETKVKHKIKHKGKSEVIESEIGVKLSKKLAKAKGLPVYGETESPGTFKGDRRLKDKNKKEAKNKRN